MKDIKKDFPFFKNNPDVIYLDNNATTLKPNVVIAAELEYYQKYCVSTHSNDYQLALDVNEQYEQVRLDVANFINGDQDEVVFVNSSTHALNQVAFGLKSMVKSGDEILLNYAEHSSNLLPWYRLAAETGAVIKYIDLDKNKLTPKNVMLALSKRTKIISFANVTNVLGYVNDTKAITKIIRDYNKDIIIVVDGVQAVGHIKTDVKDWDLDFFTFSAHKILGPTGIGVLWAKRKWLKDPNKFQPIFLGGAMSNIINVTGKFTYNQYPHCFEAGTPNIAGVWGLKAALKYLQDLGIDKIAAYELKLKQYAVEQFQQHLPNVKIYNKDGTTGTLTFNVDNKSSQDVAIYLAAKANIYLRSGEHCAKILNEYLKLPAPTTVRASFYIYNSYDDIDSLVQALKFGGDFIGDVF